MRGIDTYYGRPITAIKDDNEGNWFIELVGGVRIINLDPALSKPDIPSIENLTFLASTLEPTATTMVLGNVQDGQIVNQFRVVLNPTQYAIYDSDQQATAWSPQMNQDLPDLVIPDPPQGREANGPEPKATQSAEEPTPAVEEPQQATDKPTKATPRKGNSRSSSKSDKKKS